MNSFNKEEMENFLKIGIDRAKSSLNHFFKLLEIDPSLFDHLFDIRIFIDYNNEIIELETINGTLQDSVIATYETADSEKDDVIAISKDYIEQLIFYLNENYIARQDVINEIATTIVHELLHRNRTIILDNSLKVDDIKAHDMYEEKFKDYDLQLFKNLLDDTIKSGFYNYFDYIVPIKATINDDNKYHVVAYDKQSDCFCIYEDQTFGHNDDKFVTLLKIGLELNANDIQHTKKVSIPYKNGPYEDEYFAGSIAYYHQEDLNEPKKQRDTRLEKVSYLEESLIETIAKLIIYSRKKDNIDLEDFYNKISADENLHEDVQLVAKMLMKMDISMIEWFILSSYEDIYDDKLYKVFNDKYEKLLLYFEKMMNSFYVYPKDVRAVEEIINEKIR